MEPSYRITADNALEQHRERFESGVLALTSINLNPPVPTWGDVGSAGFAIEQINAILSHYGMETV